MKSWKAARNKDKEAAVRFLLPFCLSAGFLGYQIYPVFKTAPFCMLFQVLLPQFLLRITSGPADSKDDLQNIGKLLQ